MQVIWKFPLEIEAWRKVIMPVGAKILSLQVQNETPCLWALVETKIETEVRSFSWYGTGHTHEAIGGEYIGTIQLGGLVFHLFEDSKVLGN